MRPVDHSDRFGPSVLNVTNPVMSQWGRRTLAQLLADGE